MENTAKESITSTSFLNLLTPKDVVGINLDNRANHALFQAINQSTTMSNARMAALFNTDNEVPGIRVNSKAELVYPLKKLLEARLIQQLFFLIFNEEEGIVAKTCFVALPVEKQEKLINIYANILEQSIKNIQSYLNGYLKFDESQFAKELETNLAREPALSSQIYPISIFEPFKQIDSLDSEIPLHKSVIEATKSEIEQELILKQNIVKIEDDIYFPINENDLLRRYEIADAFIVNKLCPLHKTENAEIEKINHEEDLYRLDRYTKRETNHKKRRAELLDKILSAKHNNSSYPGNLAVLTVLLLDNKAKELYKKQEESLIQTEYDSNCKIIINNSDDWANLLHFFDEEKISSMHPESWEKLKKDKKFINNPWLSKGKEIHLLAVKNRPTFVKIIKSMYHNPPSDKWKVLAFKELLEKAEPSMTDLFKDKELIKIYGLVLKKAYVSYFPWYYPILIHFKFFLDRFFAHAKLKIKEEQEIQRQKKEKNDLEIARKKESEKLKQLAENKNIRLKNEIISILEKIFFTEESIPFFTSVMNQCNINSEEQFTEVIQNEKFQIINLKKNAEKEDMVILFPLDHEWRGRESKLKNVLHKKINTLATKPGDAKKEIFPYKMLYNHLNRQSDKKEMQEKLQPVNAEINFPDANPL